MYSSGITFILPQNGENKATEVLAFDASCVFAFLLFHSKISCHSCQWLWYNGNLLNYDVTDCYKKYCISAVVLCFLSVFFSPDPTISHHSHNRHRWLRYIDINAAYRSEFLSSCLWVRYILLTHEIIMVTHVLSETSWVEGTIDSWCGFSGHKVHADVTNSNTIYFIKCHVWTWITSWNNNNNNCKKKMEPLFYGTLLSIFGHE